MVSTTVRRPCCSAARSASAAAVVVLPTPPEPQQTTIRIAGSARSASTSRRGRGRRERHDHTERSRVDGARCDGQARSRRRRASSRPGAVDARRAAAAARSSAGPARPARRAATPPARAGSGGPAPRRAGRPPSPGRPAGRPRPGRACSSAWVTRAAGQQRRPGGVDDRSVPTGMSERCSSAIASAVSCTGISSSSVTTCTAVIGERSSAATPSLWVLIGPTLASRAVSAVTLRNRPIRPVGGASSTTASYTRRPSRGAGRRPP